MVTCNNSFYFWSFHINITETPGYYRDIFHPLFLFHMCFRKKIILLQNCSFSEFEENFDFILKKPKFWSKNVFFLEILPFYTHSTINLLLFLIWNFFRKIIFSSRKFYFGPKGILKKYSYLRRIREHICCNLLLKFFESWKSCCLPLSRFYLKKKIEISFKLRKTAILQYNDFLIKSFVASTNWRVLTDIEVVFCFFLPHM